jgi:hypothetical protein
MSLVKSFVDLQLAAVENGRQPDQSDGLTAGNNVDKLIDERILGKL